jgi:hypothetical protein
MPGKKHNKKFVLVSCFLSDTEQIGLVGEKMILTRNLQNGQECIENLSVTPLTMSVFFYNVPFLPNPLNREKTEIFGKWCKKHRLPREALFP